MGPGSAFACAHLSGMTWREFPISISNSERTCVRILAARGARALRNFSPSKDGGRRESRVRAAPAVPRAIVIGRSGTRAYRFSGGIPAFPAQWFKAYNALAPVTGLCCHRRRREVLPPADLTPASGCQTHTSLPSTTAALVIRRRRVHRIPPHVRDDRDPPLSSGETGGI